MSERLRIGTRRSPLALWQARHVRELLLAQEPDIEVELVELVTQGDKIVDRPLASVGGKGLFVKEIEEALLRGEIDVAVHSLKDLPAKLPAGLEIGAVPPREDPRDALVSPVFKTLETLPKGARVGTSSLRRACQLRALRPDLEVVSIRGNVETRLRKIEAEPLAGAVLALAGLRRLGLGARVTEILGPPRFLSAVGQGALAIEVRSGDARTGSRVERLEDPEARAAVEAERSLLAMLEGNCQVPLAAHAVVLPDREVEVLHLSGLVGAPDGSRVLRSDARAPAREAVRLGQQVARALLDQGAGAILSALHPTPAIPES